MHIPDGFLSTGVCLATGAAGGASVVWMARRAQAETEESRAPLLGVMGAFVFAAQMINFPVGVGTTGHLLGARCWRSPSGQRPPSWSWRQSSWCRPSCFRTVVCSLWGPTCSTWLWRASSQAIFPTGCCSGQAAAESRSLRARACRLWPAPCWPSAIAVVRDQDSHGHPGRVGGPIYRERSGGGSDHARGGPVAGGAPSRLDPQAPWHDPPVGAGGGGSIGSRAGCGGCLDSLL